MDPHTNIHRQRELAESIVALNGSLEIHETNKPTRAVWNYAPELAELVLALDEWRRKGGFDPYADSESELLVAMRKIVNYNLSDEEHDYAIWREENPDADDSAHIVHALRTVDRILTELTEEP